MLSQKLYRSPTPMELSNFLGIPEILVTEALNSKREVKSIDEPIASDSKEVTLHEIIPDIIYTTGAHTSLMICYLGYIFDRKIIFVEVFDRTHTPTLSGKLIYPIADTFIVQHDNYKEIYPKAKYIKGVY